jgi:hypothetical protein
MKKLIRRTAILTLATALVVIATGGKASAKTWTVTSTADDYENVAAGTLRYAIQSAADGDIIDFDPSLNGQTIDLSDELPIDSSITIEGPGPAHYLAISGLQYVRVFSISAGAQVVISGLRIEDGAGRSLTVDADRGWGGAIINHGMVTLSNCAVVSSTTGNGGGIANFGEMSIDNCAVASNHATADGGGIYNAGAMQLTGSTVSTNLANAYGGGIFNDSTGTLLLKNCNFFANQSGHGSKDIYNLGTVTRSKK